MATSQDPLAWRRQFCRGQWKEQEGEEDRRRNGKITSRNGQECSLEIPRRERWKGIVAMSSVVPRWLPRLMVPRRPPRLRDWHEIFSSKPLRKGTRHYEEVLVYFNNGGARWLSGRVSDSGARGPGFETYLRRVVSLSKTLYSPKVLVNYPGSDGSVPTWLKNCWLGR